jgi:hypothetical protein
LRDFRARNTLVAGFIVNRGLAIESLCQDSGDGGFSNTAWPKEDIGMTDLLLFKGVLKSVDCQLLVDYIFELLRSVFSK